MDAFTTHTGIAAPLRGPTSTPTRSSRPSTSSGSPAPGSRTGCSPPGAPTRLRAQPAEFAGASVLVAGPGLRHRLVPEHAVWALMDYGFRVVISLALRRHLPGQLVEGGPARRHRRAGRRRAAVEADRGRPGPRAHRRPRGAHDHRRRPRRAVQDRRLHPLAAARGPRRRRHHPALRRRHRGLRGDAAGPQADHRLTRHQGTSPASSKKPPVGPSSGRVARRMASRRPAAGCGRPGGR